MRITLENVLKQRAPTVFQAEATYAGQTPLQVIERWKGNFQEELAKAQTIASPRLRALADAIFETTGEYFPLDEFYGREFILAHRTLYAPLAVLSTRREVDELPYSIQSSHRGEVIIPPQVYDIGFSMQFLYTDLPVHFKDLDITRDIQLNLILLEGDPRIVAGLRKGMRDRRPEVRIAAKAVEYMLLEHAQEGTHDEVHQALPPDGGRDTENGVISLPYEFELVHRAKGLQQIVNEIDMGWYPSPFEGMSIVLSNVAKERVFEDPTRQLEAASQLYSFLTAVSMLPQDLFSDIDIKDGREHLVRLYLAFSRSVLPLEKLYEYVLDQDLKQYGTLCEKMGCTPQMLKLISSHWKNSDFLEEASIHGIETVQPPEYCHLDCMEAARRYFRDISRVVANNHISVHELALAA